MKNLVINSVSDFKAVKAIASDDLNKAKGSIFFWRKNLISLAKRNEFCEGVNVAVIAKAVRDYTKGGQLFDVSIFPKDSQGRFCTVSKSKKCPKYGKDLVNVTQSGWEYLQPISMTLSGVFNAFCKVAVKEIAEIEKAEKAAICEEEKAQKKAQKEADKAQKIKVRKINDLQKALDKGILTQKEFDDKVAVIKAA